MSRARSSIHAVACTLLTTGLPASRSSNWRMGSVAKFVQLMKMPSASGESTSRARRKATSAGCLPMARRSSSVFPSSSYNATNYSVDVLFAPGG